VATVVSIPDPTYDEGGYRDADLGEFLGRPVRVYSQEWAVGAALNDYFDPWSLFLDDPAIKARVNNYNLLRCKLKVKFVINGNGFHYGRTLVSYVPNLGAVAGRPQPVIPSDDQSRLIQLSQLPHMHLNPTTNEGGILELPFFWHKNWFHVAGTPDWENGAVGSVSVKSFGPLSHANAGSDPVNIMAFAWAEDVRLCIPTHVESQSDEYGKGIVGRISSATASAAGSLSRVPVIGKYAKATEQMARKLGHVASIFGFSRPIVLNDPSYMRPTYAGNLANTDAPETVRKLTFDSKQELCVDPRTVGLGDKDEMSLDYILQKESYLGTMVWENSYASDAPLGSIAVNPIAGSFTAGGGDGRTILPISFASLPFLHWSGTIIYRFQIVGSNFHKGRLRFIIDPNEATFSNLSTFNTSYTRIVDISEERDFEICVSWMQPEPYKRVFSITNATATYDFASGTAAGSPLFTNGSISVSVLNTLTSPASVPIDPVQILVSVRAGDDFCLANPSDEKIRYLSLAPDLQSQSFCIESQSDDVSDKSKGEMAPTSEVCVGESNDKAHTKMNVFFGERIVSFRSLLKRYHLLQGFGLTNSARTDSIASRVLTLSNFPYYRGFFTDGINDALVGVASVPYNYTNTTLINYLTPAYGGWRGAIRYKYLLLPYSATEHHATHSVSRFPESSGYNSVNLLSVGSSPNTSARNMLRQDTGWSGMTVSPAHTQPVLEVELPFYSPNRFAYAKALTVDGGYSYDDTDTMNHRYVVNATDDANTRLSVRRYVATGEDFNLFFFTNVPTMWEYEDPDPFA
jgi:hypothetical protein